MKKFTYYQQLDTMDCGPTCLRMISKYHGRSYTVQSLREKAQIGKEGVSLLGIAEAAESIGFRSMGVKISFKKLIEEAPLPCIVHWKQNHFVVVYDHAESLSKNWLKFIKGGRNARSSKNLDDGINLASSAFNVLDDNRSNEILYTGSTRDVCSDVRTIAVADPAKGLVTYTAEEFCQGWLSSFNVNTQSNYQEEGFVLLLEPTPNFFERDEEIATEYGFSHIAAYLLQHKLLILQLALALLIGSGLQLLFPFLTQSVIDVGVNTQNLSFIYLILGAQLMLMIGRLSVDFIRSWILLHISTRVNLSILSDFLIKLMRLPVSFFDSKHFGDIMQRIGDHQRIESFLTSQTLTVMFSMINFIIFGVVLVIYNFSIFSIFMFSTILYLFWVFLFLRQRRKLDFLRFDLSAKNQSSTVQLIQGMQEIKLASAERHMRWAWERIQIRLYRLQIRGLSLSQVQTAGAFAINEGKNILITFLAAEAVIGGKLTLGAMLAIQYIIGQMNSPVEQLIGFVQGLQDAKISLERLNEIHTLVDEEDINLSRASHLPTNKSLNLNNISFTYEGAGNEPVIHDVTFSIPAGQTTAIVGMSGSGKTTLLKLLLKFYDPTSGDIRLGGADTDNIHLKSISHNFWRSKCGAVLQDGFIFSDTIARNIAVGVDYIDTNRLDHAIHVSNLRTFIDSLPSGLHTKIGPEGNGVSQGQRQRILIARAVYKDPQYLFFDEATNSLDANNEAIIMENLNKFFLGRTVVVVAHRLSTVYNADQIIVLNKGKIIEQGSHRELISKQGEYWQLIRNQLELGS